ncbi:1-acyl-sn-glycerol-3-phosphate acyltransferase [Mucilaginibacter mali]|uniref:1-acyl-sn-glycerol-3-phosphate acyltransferase n=1 Tax=Mucilaginibacter mali TaxID=2740462 RepID=A0A7D4TXG7_9SPHI|nr:lysophospholipid acyltransferase family protein [Mucilaginibacter mali]QKJ32355.1 1-acyl-sn-glycerol-3-phosphate acyltransferase [Mucilaginibacter mali]
MITHRRNNIAQYLFRKYVYFRMRTHFRVIQHNTIDIKPGHSVLLLCNHFSWWDGFWSDWITAKVLHHKFHIMMQHDHIEARKWLRYMGGFSIDRHSKEVITSLNYTAELLNDPNNMVTVFPQGELVSNHATGINIERGIAHIVKKIKGDCQIIYYSAFIEYFESFKPSVYFHLLDCGTNRDFDFERLKAQINEHHKKSLEEQVNVQH